MTPSTLRLWLEGPLQSWGTASRFEVRTTDLWPSKSGVVGLLAAALGRPRSASVDDLAALRLGIRIERPGRIMRDYQTVGAGADGIAVASGSKSGRRGIVTERYYLEDAAFVAALESDDRRLLEACLEAVQRPHWPLALGRRACPPGTPIIRPGALVDVPLEDALLSPWQGAATPALARLAADRVGDRTVQLIVEDQQGEIEVQDQPLGAAFRARSFAVRRVRSTMASVEAS